MEKKYFLQRADELKQIFGELKFFHLRQDEKPSIFDNMKVYFEFQSTLSHLRNLMQPDKVIQNVDPDWTTKGYNGTHLNETQIYGTIYLTDEEGNELEFTYRNEDVNTTTDNNFSVEYNNFYVDFYDLIV